MKSSPIIAQGIGKTYHIWNSTRSRLVAPFANFVINTLPSTSIREWLLKKSTHSHQSFLALDDISFSIQTGESVGIIGRNGSGKSTLLQILAGTLAPTKGEVKVSGRIAALLELGSGFNPEFTGRENVFLNAMILGLSQSEIEKRFDSIAEFADIGDFIDQPIRTYSSGMALRLAFSVVVHVDADILIIDEALAVGDVFFVQKCMRWLRKFRETGTLLFVTHNAADLTNLCDRAIWLENGKIRGIGDAKTVSQDYLQSVHAETTGMRNNSAQEREKPAGMNTSPNEEQKEKFAPIVDQRRQWLNTTTYRNDIQPFDFDPAAEGFGERQADVANIEFIDAESGGPLAGIVGGEEVILRITVTAHARAEKVIVGFYLKDRLGQYLFGDNTLLTNIEKGFSISAGQSAVAEFRFQIPVLPRGKYTIAAAVAFGSYHDHRQQHWIHEAILLESTNALEYRGLVGIPMRSVTLEYSPNE